MTVKLHTLSTAIIIYFKQAGKIKGQKTTRLIGKTTLTAWGLISLFTKGEIKLNLQVEVKKFGKHHHFKTYFLFSCQLLSHMEFCRILKEMTYIPANGISAILFTSILFVSSPRKLMTLKFHIPAMPISTSYRQERSKEQKTTRSLKQHGRQNNTYYLVILLTALNDCKFEDGVFEAGRSTLLGNDFTLTRKGNRTD